MKLPKPRPLPPAVPVAALADVTLLLVFFFVLATRFDAASSAVELPVAPAPYEAAPGAACITVLRTVSSAHGEELAWRFFEGVGETRDLPGAEALYFEASRIVDDDPERTFLMRVDAGVRFAIVDDALDTLRKAGVRNVVLAARSPDAGGR